MNWLVRRWLGDAQHTLSFSAGQSVDDAIAAVYRERPGLWALNFAMSALGAIALLAAVLTLLPANSPSNAWRVPLIASTPIVMLVLYSMFTARSVRRSIRQTGPANEPPRA